MTSRALCIYHGGCTDGVAAAWALREAIPDAEFYAGVYQQAPPIERIRAVTDVYFVDFCYKPDVMRRVAGACAGRVCVLDHHDTARAGIEPLIVDGVVDGVFDMGRCGSLIAWDYFRSPSTRPELLSHIDARDRWTADRPDGNDEVIMALRSYPHDASSAALDLWGEFMRPGGVERLRSEGVAILRYYRARVDEIKARASEWEIGGLSMPAVECPFAFVSDVAGDLAAEAGCGVAAGWYTSGERVTFSLRSRGDVHAGKFCEDFAGGGGHPGAAGFAVNAEFVDLEQRIVTSPLGVG